MSFRDKLPLLGRKVELSRERTKGICWSTDYIIHLYTDVYMSLCVFFVCLSVFCPCVTESSERGTTQRPRDSVKASICIDSLCQTNVWVYLSVSPLSVYLSVCLSVPPSVC
ncbi:unnamed protein product [Gadus morhua 'NCC']